MKQQSLASQPGFEKYGRKRRRELFLDEMEKIVPWSALESLVRPHYARAGNGRQPVGLSIMLRTYFVQQWFNLSDPGVKELLYESSAVRRFVGVDLGIAPAPDETTILRFRHLLEEHGLGGLMLEAVNVHLEARGIRIQTGTIVDATILHAPSSTKNEKKARDPEMHQTRKGQQWYFGLKAHIGVDARHGHVHSVATSAASVADCHLLPDLLHGEERKVWGDGGYQGQAGALREAAPKAQDMTCRRTRFKRIVDEVQRRKNRPNRGCGPRWSIPSASSSASSASIGYGTEALPKTTTGCAPTSRWSTCISIANAWPYSARGVPGRRKQNLRIT